jgi:hypothetical protein
VDVEEVVARVAPAHDVGLLSHGVVVDRKREDARSVNGTLYIIASDIS